MATGLQGGVCQPLEAACFQQSVASFWCTPKQIRPPPLAAAAHPTHPIRPTAPPPHPPTFLALLPLLCPFAGPYCVSNRVPGLPKLTPEECEATLYVAEQNDNFPSCPAPTAAKSG